MNILLAGLLFRSSPAINRLLGKSGAKILSRISSLLLAAIAVMIVRKGIAVLVSSGWTGG